MASRMTGNIWWWIAHPKYWKEFGWEYPKKYFWQDSVIYPIKKIVCLFKGHIPIKNDGSSMYCKRCNSWLKGD